jgi:Holliday junction resolvasome RuvABC ATP-dependent DNA helicase subunit
VSDVTFVFATTDFGSLDRALRSRLERIDLDAYTLEQVAQMVEAAHPGWPSPVYAQLATAGKRVPRIALARARDLQRWTDTFPSETPEELATRLLQTLGIDRLGISKQDRQLLRLLAEERSPRGVAYLASRLALSGDDIVDVIEPYLTDLGLLTREAGGRTITDQGRRYLRDVRE